MLAASSAAAPLDRRLLLASFAAGPAAEDQPAGSALQLLEQGEYAGALATALRAAWAVGRGGDGGNGAAADWFAEAAEVLERALAGDAADNDAAEQLLLAAVAALYLFVQANLAGPDLPLPECPFDWLDAAAAADWQQRRRDEAARQKGGGAEAGAGAAKPASDAFGRDSTSPGDRWACTQLSENGEDLIGRTHHPQYLLLARTVLLAPLQVVPPASEAGSGAAAAAGAAATVRPAAGAGWLQQQTAGVWQDEGQQDAARAAPSLAGWCWWAQRAVLLQQRLLSGRSASLRSLLLGLGEQVLVGFAAPVEAALAAAGEQGDLQQTDSSSSNSASPSAASQPSPEDQLLASGALLEAALLETAYGHVESTRALLQRASAVLGFSSELTGALGVRTVHQSEAKAQLLVGVCRQQGNPWTTAHAAGAAPDEAVPQAELEAALAGQVELPDELKGFTADSDVLPHPQLLPDQQQQGQQGQQQQAGDGPGPSQPAPAAASAASTPAPVLAATTDLHSMEQALLMGWCLHVRKGSAADGLQPWEMAAYVDAVARQQRSQFLLHAAAALQASRLEKQRSRTRDRALLQMEQLSERLERASHALPPALRLRYAFSVWFPLAVSLRKELGELLVGMGLVGAALAVFERLELWDNLIVCYQLLGKKVQAEELIKRRLEATPDEPRLWCALGDLSLDDAHYQRAWEASGHRNARSQRSLARNALRTERYAQAAQHWEAALALNPLHGEGWFSLGYCYIKAKDYQAALRAFTRSSQLEPENGEAWNNLAAIHMHLQHWPQAFNALTEAVKYKRDNWQTWENYAQVATRVGQWQTAVRALQQVLAQSEGQRVDLEVVAALVQQVEAARAAKHAAAGEAGGEGEEGASAGGEAAQDAQQQQQQQQPSDAAVAAEGAMPADDGSAASAAEAELAAALGQLSTAGAAGAVGGADPQAQAQAAEALAKADARAQQVLEQSVGQLLKQIAATVSGGSAFWEVYARYQAAIGYPDAAKECLLKRVRALGGTGGQASQEAFEAYAQASAALCEAYLQGAESTSGTAAQRDVSSARLHLRGLLKQAAERFEDTEAYRRLQALQGRVDAAQARLRDGA